MGCLEGSGVPVLYIGRTVSKGSKEVQTLHRRYKQTVNTVPFDELAPYPVSRFTYRKGAGQADEVPNTKLTLQASR
jgi:hypothetical protein